MRGIEPLALSITRSFNPVSRRCFSLLPLADVCMADTDKPFTYLATGLPPARGLYYLIVGIQCSTSSSEASRRD